MTYDGARNTVVMFGGADATRVRADTWEWDGDRWRTVTSNGPSPRTFPAMVYDGARRETVLFGGNAVLFGSPEVRDRLLADTWRLSGGSWHRVDVSGPPARAEAAIGYDVHRARVVLFGGYQRSDTDTIRLGDTWEWDGAAWTQAATSGPSPRNGAALAYDGQRQRLVLFGGSGRASDTWEWDGVAWLPREAGVAPGRYNAAMTYMPPMQSLLRFGGWTGTERVGDTWLLDVTGWRELPVPGPAARNHSVLTYDARRGRAVLFGGHDGEQVFGDLWEWDGRRWLRRRSVPAERRISNGH
jgi:hypothetical protein